MGLDDQNKEEEIGKRKSNLNNDSDDDDFFKKHLKFDHSLLMSGFDEKENFGSNVENGSINQEDKIEEEEEDDFYMSDKFLEMLEKGEGSKEEKKEKKKGLNGSSSVLFVKVNNSLENPFAEEKRLILNKLNEAKRKKQYGKINNLKKKLKKIEGKIKKHLEPPESSRGASIDGKRKLEAVDPMERLSQSLNLNIMESSVKRCKQMGYTNNTENKHHLLKKDKKISPAMRMMMKMNYKVGEGLGKDNQGRKEPVSLKLDRVVDRTLIKSGLGMIDKIKEQQEKNLEKLKNISEDYKANEQVSIESYKAHMKQKRIEEKKRIRREELNLIHDGDEKKINEMIEEEFSVEEDLDFL